jgi:hypothetical protein
LVADIFPGKYGSLPSYLTNVNGTLFFSANDGVHGAEPWVLGPVSASASAASESVVPPFVVSGPFTDVTLTLGAAGLRAPAVANQPSSGLESADSGGRERLLLEDSRSAGTETHDSARRSPAVFGTKSQTHGLEEFWSEDPAISPLVPDTGA